VPPMPENPALTEEERAELQRLRAEVATLRSQVQLRSRIDTGRGTVGVASLTTADLRLLPLLYTHLTFPEIGERLYVSRHTVKTQALSVYRKLGASTRSQAVQRAQQLDLGG
jgi:LuxR family transcriptional regulator, maltose regulon positive regulatory protein